MNFRVLCDVHIARKVVSFFSNKGYESIHINDILDSYYTKDNDISKYADENGFIVLTKDHDFKNSPFLNNKPKRILLITLGNIPTKRLIELFEKKLIRNRKLFLVRKMLCRVRRWIPKSHKTINDYFFSSTIYH